MDPHDVDPRPRITAAAAAGSRRFVVTAPAAALTCERTGRLIEGLAVPWDTPARVQSGELVRFRRGSLDPASSSTARLLRDHDWSQAVGRVLAAADRPEGLWAQARVSAVPAGDEVLTLAADGVLDGLSVGVDADEWTIGDDGVLDVLAGTWDELSILARPAYDAARVWQVAASAPEPEAPEPTPPPTTPEPEPAPEPAQHVPTVVPITAARPPRDMSFGGLVRTIAAAAGSREAVRVNAALTDLSTAAATMGGLVHPGYETEVAGLIAMGRPVVSAFEQRIATAMTIHYPYWTTLPLVDVQAGGEKTAVASGPAKVEDRSVALVFYAGANDISVQVMDWSTPDVISEYLRAAAEVYARKTDNVMQTAVLTAAADTAVAGSAGFIDDIGVAMGKIAATGLPADLILCSADVYGSLWSQNVTGAQGGGITVGLNVTMQRPRVVVMPLAPALTLIVGSSQAARSYERSPVDVRAWDVALGGLNIGIWGYFAPVILYPAALQQITGVVLPLAGDDGGGTRTGGRKSSS